MPRNAAQLLAALLTQAGGDDPADDDFPESPDGAGDPPRDDGGWLGGWGPDLDGWWETLKGFWEEFVEWCFSLPNRAWEMAQDLFWWICDYVLDLLIPLLESLVDAIPGETLQAMIDAASAAAPLLWFFDGWFPLTEALALWGSWYTFLGLLTAAKWLIKFIPTVG